MERPRLSAGRGVYHIIDDADLYGAGSSGPAVPAGSDEVLKTLHVTCCYVSRRGLDLISDALPFGRLWYGDANAVANAIGYAEHYSRSHDGVIRVYDEAGTLIETHEHKDDCKEP